jgi:hypothetical protein
MAEMIPVGPNWIEYHSSERCITVKFENGTYNVYDEEAETDEPIHSSTDREGVLAYAEQTANNHLANELMEIQQEMLELVNRAEGLLKGYAPKHVTAQAQAYWIAHIKSALGDENYDTRFNINVGTTLEQLRP